MDNPAFEGAVDPSSTTGASSTGPSFPGTSQAPDTSAPSPETSAPETGSTGTEPEGTSESGPDTGTGNIIDEFCQGAQVCFPIDQLDASGSIQDFGPRRRLISFATPVVLAQNVNDPAPLSRSVVLTKESGAQSTLGVDLANTDQVGFDFWFAPQDLGSNNYNVFALLGLMSAERLVTGHLRCGLINRLVNVGPIATPNFQEGTLHHMACAVRGEQLMMWLDGQLFVHPFSVSMGDDVRLPSIGLGTATDSRVPFEGRVAGARVWTNIDKMIEMTGLVPPAPDQSQSQD